MPALGASVGAPVASAVSCRRRRTSARSTPGARRPTTAPSPTPAAAEFPALTSSARLRLRRFAIDDAAWFAELNADPEVTRHLGDGRPLDRPRSDDLLARILEHWAHHGFGLWAAERLDRAEPIGFVGLSIPAFLAHPDVEVGWRLGSRHWGQGFASEGGRVALAVGFRMLGLDRIISVTVHDNLRSQRVMTGLGLAWDRADVHLQRGKILQVRSIDRATWEAEAAGPSTR